MTTQKHHIQITARKHPFTLTAVAGLLTRRRYELDYFSISNSSDPEQVLLSITVITEQKEQLIAQLSKLYAIISIIDIPEIEDTKTVFSNCCLTSAA